METLEQYLERRAKANSPLAALLRLPAAEQQRMGVAHTAREILMQPWVWRETAQAVFRQTEALLSFLSATGKVTDVVFTGAGSSAYAGWSLAPLFQQQCYYEAREVPTTDLLMDGGRGTFLTGDALWGGSRHYLLVSLARSGDSPESIGTVDRVLRDFPGVRHLILCCNANGALAQKYQGHPKVFTLVLPEAANDQGLMMTCSFTNLVVAGQCVAYLELQKQYAGILDTLVEAAERVLDSAGAAEKTASSTPERVCLLASRTLAGVAREGALKLLESTAGRVTTLAETFLGLRHGPIAFLNAKTALLYFFSADPYARRYELDLVRQVRAKGLGMMSVALGPGDASQETNLSLSAAYAEPIPDVCRPPVDALFPQMLALFLSLRVGLRPDAPNEGGVIHRVVQGVTVYESGDDDP